MTRALRLAKLAHFLKLGGDAIHMLGQLIEGADELDNGGGDGQKRRTLQKILLF